MNLPRHLRVTAVAALAFSLGLHWMVLQSVAWISMAVEFSRDLPTLTALKRAFDRQHACHLCRVVAAGKKSQQDDEGQSLSIQLEAVLNPSFLRVHPPASWQPAFTPQSAWVTLGAAPRPPPPRFSA